MSSPDKQSVSSRRGFLKCASGIGLSLGTTGLMSALPSRVMAADIPALDPKAPREIRIVNAHTWEKLDIVYYIRGIYIDESLERLNHLMRDHRAGKAHVIDTALLDQLFRVRLMLGTDEAVHVLSGYRTPETNARLRSRSSGVAKYSLHMEGRAADIYIPEVPVQTLHKTAMDMAAGGVGLYSNSNFVHLDTGNHRHWGS